MRLSFAHVDLRAQWRKSFEERPLQSPVCTMAERLVRSESPTEFFRELVESALQHQHVSVNQLTSFYVVNLLARFVRPEQPATCADERLGIRLAAALQAAGAAQREELKEVGDLSLFIAGFFADSLSRRLVDVDYYIQLGERAYGSLARHRHADRFGDVFDELAEKFGDVVDVLGEVSASTSLTSDTDLLRLYDTWVRTRSRRSGSLLAARGIAPNQSLKNRFVQ